MNAEQLQEKNRAAVRKSPSSCSKCKAPIYWLTTAAGKSAPVDAAGVSGFSSDGTVRTVFVSHFATCPAAKDFRKADK